MLTHLAGQGIKLLASGTLLAIDGTTVVGGASLFDTNDYEEAARFEAEDPYAKAGIRARVEIVEWRLRWWFGTVQRWRLPAIIGPLIHSRFSRALLM